MGILAVNEYETPQKKRKLLYDDMPSFKSRPVFSDSYLKDSFTAMVAFFDTPDKDSSSPSISVKSGTTTDDEDRMSEAYVPESPILSPMKLPNDTLSADVIRMPTLGRSTTPDRKISQRLRNFSGGVAGSESSVRSTESTQSTKDRCKWINEFGLYDLDKLNTCQLGFITEHIAPSSVEQLSDELSTNILSSCTLLNKERYRIEFGHEDIVQEKNKKKDRTKQKISGVKLKFDDSELSKIVLNYRDKVQSAVRDVFGIAAEFDRVVVNRLSDDQHSIPYETYYSSDTSGFSPTVAILALGPARPLFMKTVPGNLVTHKVSLEPGSLCVLSGRTECRYRHSIPKNYGAEQFIITIIERTPDDSILKELMKIEIPPKDPPSAVQLPDSRLEETTDKPKDTLLEDQHPDSNSEAKPEPVTLTQKKETAPTVFTFENTSTVNVSNILDTSDHLKTPLTVKPFPRLNSSILKDGMDFEPGASLLLAETLSTTIYSMDEAIVTAELLRNQTSTLGTLEEKRKRLLHRICLSIGELNSNIPDTSMKLMCLNSPDVDPISLQKLQTDLTTVSNSQTNIEGVLATMLNTILGIQTEIATIRSEAKPTTDTSDGHQADITKNPIQPVKDDSSQIKSLSDSLSAMKTDMENYQDDLERVATILNSRTCGEGTLIDVVGAMTDVKTELALFRSTTNPSTTENDSSDRKKSVSATKKLGESVTECSHQTKLLADAISAMKTEVEKNRDDVKLLSERVMKTKSDLEEWYTSAFFDGESSKIKDIHERKMNCTEHCCNKNGINESCQNGTSTQKRSSTTSTEVVSRSNQSLPSSSQFQWPDRLSLTLKAAVKNRKKVSVCLVTDSIMRHVKETDFSDKYCMDFIKIDTRDMSGLLHGKVKETILRKKPHIIYIHLGINNIQNGDGAPEISNMFGSFDLFLQDELPETKIIVSLPLYNGYEFQYRQINHLRASLMQYINKFGGDNADNRRLYYQRNINFFIDDSTLRQNVAYHNSPSDLVHLSDRGKGAIICNMRDSLHRLLRGYLRTRY